MPKGAELGEGVIEEGRAAEGEEGLGAVVGQRPQAGAEAGGEEEGGVHRGARGEGGGLILAMALRGRVAGGAVNGRP
jgi:hypothetical protein